MICFAKQGRHNLERNYAVPNREGGAKIPKSNVRQSVLGLYSAPSIGDSFLATAAKRG